MNYYNSDKKVKIGDLVSVHFWGTPKLAKVIKIISPNTEDAITWAAPEGGVLINGVEVGSVLCKSLEADEDVIFISRKMKKI
jgi:hypothetical protein